MKKTREITFETSKELVLKDKFGNDLSEWKIFKLEKTGSGAEISQKFTLEIPQKDSYYQSRENERFFIYDGVGELKLSECTEKWDFSEINLPFLDYFAAKGEHEPSADDKDKELIEKFMDFQSKFGTDFEKLKIKPPYYKFILETLATGL